MKSIYELSRHELATHAELMLLNVGIPAAIVIPLDEKGNFYVTAAFIRNIGGITDQFQEGPAETKGHVGILKVLKAAVVAIEESIATGQNFDMSP